MSEARPIPAIERATDALIGGLLIDGATVAEVAETIAADDLPFPRARAVFRAMLSLYAAGMAVDFVTVCAELEAAGRLTAATEAWLLATINRCPSSLLVLDYARLVAAAASRRPPRGAIAL